MDTAVYLAASPILTHETHTPRTSIDFYNNTIVTVVFCATCREVLRRTVEPCEDVDEFDSTDDIEHLKSDL